MFTLPLPPSPDIDHYRTLARELKDACERGAVREFSVEWTRRLSKHVSLSTEPVTPASLLQAGDRMERWWQELRARQKLTGCTLADARFFIARAHGFASW